MSVGDACGGASETAIGQAIERRRDKFGITTKWCPHHVGRPPKKQTYLDQLDASLKRLRTDHVDIVLNHEVGRISDDQGPARLDNPEMHEAFETARARVGEQERAEHLAPSSPQIFIGNAVRDKLVSIERRLAMPH